MPNRNKQKGNRVEREVVNLAKKMGLVAVRAYASNGLSLGMAEEVDVLIEGDYRVQVKSKKQFPKWLTAAQQNVDWVVLKENGKPAVAMLPFEELCCLIARLKLLERPECGSIADITL